MRRTPDMPPPGPTDFIIGYIPSPPEPDESKSIVMLDQVFQNLISKNKAKQSICRIEQLQHRCNNSNETASVVVSVPATSFDKYSPLPPALGVPIL